MAESQEKDGIDWELVRERLRPIWKEKGLHMKAASKAIGRKDGYISDFMACNADSIGMEELEKLAYHIGETVEWLTDKGPRNSTDPSDRILQIVRSKGKPEKVDLETVKLASQIMVDLNYIDMDGRAFPVVMKLLCRAIQEEKSKQQLLELIKTSIDTFEASD